MLRAAERAQRARRLEKFQSRLAGEGFKSVKLLPQFDQFAPHPTICEF